MLFLTYPTSSLPALNQHILLVMEGAPELSAADQHLGIILLDSTWRYLDKMVKFVERDTVLQKRTLPGSFRTAYPRRQDDCLDPQRGLSSLEALFIAYHILSRPADDLLSHYYWRNQFLEINEEMLRKL